MRDKDKRKAPGKLSGLIVASKKLRGDFWVGTPPRWQQMSESRTKTRQRHASRRRWRELSPSRLSASVLVWLQPV